MTRADEDESSSDLWGDSRKYEELASHLLDTVPPSGQISPLTSAPKDVPPDGALRRHSEKLRTAEAHRRREYHELLSIPGDKSQDVEWAEDFVENLLKNIAPYGRGVMTAY